MISGRHQTTKDHFIFSDSPVATALLVQRKRHIFEGDTYWVELERGGHSKDYGKFDESLLFSKNIPQISDNLTDYANGSYGKSWVFCSMPESIFDVKLRAEGFTFGVTSAGKTKDGHKVAKLDFAPGCKFYLRINGKDERMPVSPNFPNDNNCRLCEVKFQLRGTLYGGSARLKVIAEEIYQVGKPQAACLDGPIGWMLQPKQREIQVSKQFAIGTSFYLTLLRRVHWI